MAYVIFFRRNGRNLLQQSCVIYMLNGEMVSCLGYCGRQPQDISTWVSFSVFPVSSSCSLPRVPLLVMTMSLLQPCEVLSHLLKCAFRENFENVSNKAWLAYPPREKARRRKLTWRLPSTSEPETYELISRVITYWSPSMCRHCSVMWTGRVVAQGAWGGVPLMEVLC